MSNLRHILTRIESVKEFISNLNSEYEETKLPKGRNYLKKMAEYNRMLDRLNGQLIAYGKGLIYFVTIKNFNTNEVNRLVLSIPLEEINPYIETFYPGWSIITKLPIKTGVILGNKIVAWG